jgi:hypothetical protein
MKRTVTPEALKLTSELMQQGDQTGWRICDEYQIRGREIIARYSPPWIVAPDSPPWTGEEELHWRSYEPLKETPDLFLKLAHLHQEPNFERAVLTFSHTYGVLGGSSTMGSSPRRYRPYRDSIPNFQEEAKRAWTILKMYEAVLARDWMAAKSLLIADEDFGGEEDYPYDDSPETYLFLALHGAALRVGHTVGQLCRPTLRFTESSRLPDVDPASIESAWRFESLLGVAYLQMYWLMTSGGNITRCEYCGQVLSLAKTHPDGRKRRRDRRFCDDACRQGHHRTKKRPADSSS